MVLLVVREALKASGSGAQLIDTAERVKKNLFFFQISPLLVFRPCCCFEMEKETDGRFDEINGDNVVVVAVERKKKKRKRNSTGNDGVGQRHEGR